MSRVRLQTTSSRSAELERLTLRKRVNLAALPLWSQYVVALAVAGAVIFPAWLIGRNRPTPAWLEVLQPVWMVVGPALIVLFVVKWVVKQFRGR
jgi:hypothetical protein